MLIHGVSSTPGWLRELNAAKWKLLILYIWIGYCWNIFLLCMSKYIWYFHKTLSKAFTLASWAANDLHLMVSISVNRGYEYVNSCPELCPKFWEATISKKHVKKVNSLDSTEYLLVLFSIYIMTSQEDISCLQQFCFLKKDFLNGE